MKTKKIFLLGIFLTTFLGLLLCFYNPAYAFVQEKSSSEKQDFLAYRKAVHTPSGVSMSLNQREKLEKEKLRYLPGQVIIRLKETKSIQVLYAESYSQRIAIHQNKLSSLKNKYGLQNERPVFETLHHQLKANNSSQKSLEEQIKAKNPEKQKGAPRSKNPVDLLPIYLLTTSKDVMETCRELKNDPDIEYAEPNYTMKAQMVPNDPYYSSSGSWGQSYDDLWGLKKIQCEQAWDASQGEGVVVAVIDTGVDYTHPDLAANMWDDGQGHHGYDFVNNDNDPMDDFGHGTHCAGTIAAVGNNSLGVTGVAPKAKIMAVKGLDVNGSGYVSALASCVQYAADNGASVLNNSWGGSGISQTLTDAFHYAYSKGCVAIAAAGNSTADASDFTPANIDTVITVSATDESDKICGFSNYGVKIDVSAPGGGVENEIGGGWSDIYNILSTMPDNCTLASIAPYLKVSNGYWRLAGTSMACPHVAGLAALILAKNPSFSNDDIRKVIQISADDIEYPLPSSNQSMPGFDRYTGYGRINAKKALSITTPPDINGVITSPAFGSLFTEKQTIQIQGSACGNNFDHYTLSYAKNDQNYQWKEFYSSNTPVSDGVLGSLDLSTLSSDSYTLLLTVFSNIVNEGIQYDIFFPVNFDFCTISPNIDGFPRRLLGGEVNFNFGGGLPFVNDIDYDGINELIYVSDTNCLHVEPKGQYIMPELTFMDSLAVGRINSDPKKAIVFFYRDPSGETKSSLMAINSDGERISGWPVALTGNCPTEPGASVVLADLNGDGQNIIVVNGVYPYNGNPYEQFVYFLKGDGSIIKSIETVPYPGSAETMRNLTAACGDLNGDGKEEYVTGGIYHYGHGSDVSGYLYAFQMRDNTIQQMPGTRIDIDFRPDKLLIADINNDGFSELICLGNKTDYSTWKMDTVIKVYSFASGSPKVLWAYTVNNRQLNQCYGLAVGKIDKSVAGLQIVFSIGQRDSIDSLLFTSSLYILKSDGTLYAPPIPTRDVLCNILLADVNGDNNVEILGAYNKVITTTSGFDAGIDAYNISGFEVEGFPIHSIADFVISGCPMIDDVNNDGIFDIVQMDAAYLNGLGWGTQFLYAWPMTGPYKQDSKEWPMVMGDARNSSAYQDHKPPILDPIPNQSVTEQQTLTFTVTGSSPHHNPIKLSVAGMPETAQFDTATGIFTWKPLHGDSKGSPYHVTFTVTDMETRLTASQTVAITVDHANRPPVLDPIGNKTTDENKKLEFAVTAHDPDGDQVILSAKPLPRGAAFEYGVFTWVPTYDQAGSYTVEFTATDSSAVTPDGSNSVSETITITVNNVNRPPVLNKIANKTVDENKKLEFTISGYDPDNDPITFSATNLPKGALFNDSTRTFTWTPGYDQAGIYQEVAFIVSDGKASAARTITITVNNVNRPPVLDPIGDKVVREGSLLQFTVSAKDPDGNKLTYSAINLPKGATIDSRTGRFSWIPDYNQAGTYVVTFMASDGSLSDKQKVAIKVTNVPIPDLTAGAIAYRATGNKLYTFMTPIKNIGDRAVTTPFYVSYYVDNVTKNSTRITYLDAGRNIIVPFSWVVVKGTHTIKVVADSTNTISEADENNNVSEITVKVP